MGRTISGARAQAIREEYNYHYNQRLLELLAQGKRVPANKADVVSEQEILTQSIAKKTKRLENERLFDKEFKKHAGKKINTAKVFEKVVGKSAEKNEGLSA